MTAAGGIIAYPIVKMATMNVAQTHRGEFDFMDSAPEQATFKRNRKARARGWVPAGGAGVKHHLADAYDAAQERVEIKSNYQTVPFASAEDGGLSRREIHEARIIRHRPAARVDFLRMSCSYVLGGRANNAIVE